MGIYLAYILKSAFCLAAFYLFYKLLLTRDTFHRMNRITLLLCMVLSCLIPAVNITVKQPTLVSQPIQELEDFFLMSSVQEEAGTSINWIAFLLLIYLLGVLSFLLYYSVSAWKLVWMVRHFHLQKLGDVTLVTHSLDMAPFSWLHYIFISKNDLKENADVFLTHERAHIHCHHSYDLMLATFCTILQWFNPAVWLIKQELQNIHEYEADDQVLNQGIDAKMYQILLIKKAAGARLYSLANSFNHSSLKKRITMMLSKKSSAWARAKYLFVVPVSVLAVSAFARPEVVNLSQKMEAVTIIDLAATVSKVTKNVSSVQTPQGKIASAEIQPAAFGKTEMSVDQDTTKIHQAVEQMPQFPGGMHALMEFLARKLKYPKELSDAGIGGHVIVQFIVAKDGTIQTPEVIRSVHPQLDAEALRVISAMPAWEPGKEKGEPVNVRFTIPVTFRATSAKDAVIVIDSLATNNPGK